MNTTARAQSDRIPSLKALRGISALAILLLTFCLGLLISHLFSSVPMIKSASTRLIFAVAGAQLFFTVALFRSHRALEMTTHPTPGAETVMPQWTMILYAIFIIFLMALPH